MHKSSAPCQQNECNTKLHRNTIDRPQFKRVRRHRAHHNEDKTKAIKFNTAAVSSPTVNIKSFFTPVKRNADNTVTPTPDKPVELKTNNSGVNVKNLFPESDHLKGWDFSGTQKKDLILMQTPCSVALCNNHRTL